jgi:ribonucleoside-diphosphate reductase alpha chain
MAFEWANEWSRMAFSRGYLTEGQTVESRVLDIADCFAAYYGSEKAKKFYKYMGEGYYSLASPIWANYGLDRGLPVSCFGAYIEDDMNSILYTQAETGKLIQSGGGTSGYFGAIRPRGSEITNNGKSSGSVHFMQLFDTISTVVSQGSTRRGFFSAYQDIEHADAKEFLAIGSDGNPIQDLTTGIVVGDEWLEQMIAGDEDKRALWASVLETRSRLGYPYIMFRDNANKAKPECYKDSPIHASNMCSEIMLPSNKDETFVCVLSSMNLVKYDEWKDTDAVEILTYFLDSVVSEFVEKIRYNPTKYRFMERAATFAYNHRALGLGVLGWHHLLQSKMIPFESRDAAKLNLEVFKFINQKALEASKKAAEEFGECRMTKGTGRRNATLMAIAPTKSSSFLLGQVSQSIEPEFSNCYIKDLAKAKVTVKNPYLTKLLQEKGRDTADTWDLIIKNDGSVQNLPFLSDEEKAVFRTFAEISPEAIINQAAVRQPYIDQGQSLNLMIDPKTPVRDINKLYLDAWKLGIKSLYYQYSINASQALTRKKLATEGCAACEG